MSTMMHPDQVETNPELVRALLRRQMPELAGLPIAARPFSGTDNAVYRVGERYSVRLPIIDWAVGNEARIRPWLPWLRERLDIAVPVPLLYGEPDCGYPHQWTVYPWFTGETLEVGCGDHRVARDIAAFLTQVRRLPTHDAPASGRSPHALDADVRKCLNQLFDDDSRDDLITIWNEMMATPPWDGTGAF